MRSSAQPLRGKIIREPRESYTRIPGDSQKLRILGYAAGSRWD